MTKRTNYDPRSATLTIDGKSVGTVASFSMRKPDRRRAPHPGRFPDDFAPGSWAWAIPLGRLVETTRVDVVRGFVFVRSVGWPGELSADPYALLLLDRAPAPGVMPWIRPPKLAFVA